MSRDLKRKPIGLERPELPVAAVWHTECEPSAWFQPAETAFECLDGIVEMLEHHPCADQIELRVLERCRSRIAAQYASASPVDGSLGRRFVHFDPCNVPSLPLHLQQVVA